MCWHSVWAVCRNTINSVCGWYISKMHECLEMSPSSTCWLSPNTSLAQIVEPDLQCIRSRRPCHTYLFAGIHVTTKPLPHRPSSLPSDTIDLFSSQPAKLRLAVGRSLRQLIRPIRVSKSSICLELLFLNLGEICSINRNEITTENSSLKHCLLD